MKNNIVVSICNAALAESGNSSTITSLSENTQLAELCNRFWAPTVEEMYSDHAWGFRKLRVQATLVSAGTNANEYAYPEESLRILGFYSDAGYQIRDKSAAVRANSNGETALFSAYIPLFIEYIVASTDNDSIPPLVRKCLTCLLASKIAVSQGKDDTKLLQKYQYWLDRAEENDSTEDKRYCTSDDRFIDCR